MASLSLPFVSYPSVPQPHTPFLRKPRLTGVLSPTISSVFVLETKILNIWPGPIAFPFLSGALLLHGFQTHHWMETTFRSPRTFLQPSSRASAWPSVIITTFAAHYEASLFQDSHSLLITSPSLCPLWTQYPPRFFSGLKAAFWLQLPILD